MFFLGITWIGIVLHIGMLHLGIAAGAKRIPQLWMIVPVVFYAGNLALFGVSYFRATTDADQIEKANVEARVKIAEPYTILLHDNAPGLIERYRVEWLYQHEFNDYFSTWRYARGVVCDTPRSASLIEGFYTVMRSDLFPAYHGADKTRQCVLSRRGLSGDADYRYRIEPKTTQTSGIFRFATDRLWTVTEEKTGTVIVTVHTAKIGVWPPIAIFVAGCSLNSGAARWDCDAGMLRWYSEVYAGYKAPPPQPIMLNPPPVPEPEMLEISAVARALSIPLRTPVD